MSTIIKVENLGKSYTISHEERVRYTALRDVVARKTKNLFTRLSSPVTYHSSKEEFWALKDINFEVNQGDRIGIIGRNGAGKSTLLKILSRITDPTTGSVKIKGRVASLLEVGTGFHPELTGAENIFLNGAILGMSRNEVKKKFDEIVDFAEVEKFLDTPVKRYSSGMYVRLAFAVAAHLEPEILVVDEVLAVGDAEFQKKCLGKMEDVSKNEGRTVLFVSHNLGAISSLCKNCFLLNQGILISSGPTSEVILKYYTDGNVSPASFDLISEGKKVGDGYATLFAGWVNDDRGVIKNEFLITESIEINMKYVLKKKTDSRYVPNFHFFTANGNYAFVITAPNIIPMPEGIYIAKCIIPPNLLNDGTLFIGMALTSYYRTGFDVNFYYQNCISINLIDPMDETVNRYGYIDKMPGVVRPALEWKITKE